MTEDGFDAAAAAARATGEAVDAATDDVDETTTDEHAAAEGTAPSSALGSTEGLRDALLSTEPTKPLETVESPWNPGLGGASRIYRGMQKMTGVDGLPAIADVGIGIAELWQDKFVVDGDQEDADDVEEAGDDAGALI
jgi:hypothetical protein